MFLIKYLKYSFDFKNILKKGEEPFLKVLVYFLLLMLISTFPLSYLIVKHDGTQIDFIIEDMKDAPRDWNLPISGASIKGNKLVFLDNKEYLNTHKGITYIFNYQNDEYELTFKQILLKENNIIYIDGLGNVLESKGYNGFFQDEFDLTNLTRSTESDLNNYFLDFGYGIEKSFSAYIILYALLRNVLITLVINFVFVLLMALLMQLFRLGHAKFLTIMSSLKIVMLASLLPTILSFIFGLIVPGFAPVVFNLTLGLIIMIVMLVFSRKQIA